MLVGYSDRINHALAFAAKHHDKQVRKGTQTPYLTHPANVAIILTRYGQPEDTVIGGILHDVIEDCVRDGLSARDLEERIGRKFGDGVLETVLSVTKRRTDEDGMPLSSEDQKADYLARLSDASDAARWVCCADKVHNSGALVADVRRAFDPAQVWGRFGGGRSGTMQWYVGVVDRLDALKWSAPILDELRHHVAQLQALP